MVAAVAMFFYTRPEVIEEQPMPGFHLKRQVYRTDDNTPVNHGWWELRDGEQHLVCEGRYRNDQPSGEWTWRHPNGRPRQQGEYRQGRRHGLWKTWYDDGRPREEWTYADGTLDGPARSWWPSSHVGESLRDSRSRLGETRPRAASSQLASEGTYAAGRQSGQWTFYNEQGQQTASGNYENGAREGDWLAWDDDGNELPTQHYAGGRLIPDDKPLVEAWRERLYAHVGESLRDSQSGLGETGPRSAGYAKRCEAAWALGRLGEPGLAVLNEAAGSADAEVRSLAFLELVEQPKWTEANVPRLVAALDEPSEHVQLAAMLALSPLSDRAEAAVPRLEQLLRDDEAKKPGYFEQRGFSASSANGSVNGSYNVPVDHFAVCVLATLVSIVPERDDLVAKLVRAYPAHALYAEAYGEVTRYLAPSAQPGLLKAVKSPDAEVRAAALATLGSAVRAGRFPTSATAVQVFAEALSDGEATVRRQACDAIGAFGPDAKDLKPQLQKAANDPDPEVAKAAQNAIQFVEGGGRGSAIGGFF